MSQAKELFDEAEQEIVAATWHQETTVLRNGLESAFERGIAVTFLAYDACDIDFGTVKEHGFEDDLEAQLVDAQGRWLALVVDKAVVVLGSSLDQSPAGAWSNHSALANIVHRYVLGHFFAK